MKNILTACLLALIVASCQKSDRDEDKSLNSSTDNAFAANIVFDIFKVVDEAAINTAGISNSTPPAPKTSLYGCDTLISDTTTSPMPLQIDFNNGCSANGRNYSGVINAAFTGKYNIPGSVVTVSFSNYYFMSYKIDGSMTINCQPPSASGKQYKITTNNLSVLASNGKQLLFNANYVYERIEGDTSFAVTDDAYSVTGSASGYSFQGNQFTSTITSAVRYEYGCKWMLEGKEEVTPTSKSVRKVDYGSGCDNAFTIDLNGVIYNSTIP